MTTMMSHHFKLPPTAAATATTAAAAAVVAGGGGGSGVATHVVATPLSSSAPATAAGAAAAGLLATAAAATVSSTTAAGASHTATAATHTGPQGTTTTYSAFLAAATMNHLHYHQPAESDELAAVGAAAAANFAAGEAATDVENATPASITHRRKCQQFSADAGDDAGAATAAAAGAAMGDSDDAAMMMIKANNNNSGSEEQQDSALDTNSGGSRSDDGGVPPDDAAVATAPAADSDPAALPPLSAATPTGGEEPAYVSSKLADEHRAANALLAQNPHLADAVRDVFTKLGCSAMPCETADEDQYWRDVVGHFVRNNAQRDAGHDDMDPFYVVDLGRVVMQMAKFRRHLPGVHPYYAIKCNPSDFLLKMIAALGGNFDCASSAELKQVIEGGFATPDGVIFANPCKSVSDLKKAEAMGVRYVTFDNPAELAKIAEHMPSAKAVLRIKTADTAARCAFSTKFGASMSDVPMLLQTALELGVRIVGVSFHVGSGNNDPHAYVGSVENARRVFDDAEALGFDMKLLDLGGGFPGTDAPVNELTGKPDALNFEDIAAALRPVLASLFPTARVIAEPGRYFTAATHTLAMNVHSMRKVPLPTGFTAPGAHVPAPSAPSSRLTASALAAAASTPPEALPQSLSNDWMLGGAAALPPPLFEYQYYVNDGLYHSFNCIVFDHARPQLNLLNPDSESRLHVSTMFGPTCDSLDCILKRQLFPELCIGDWLFVRSMGSYTTAAGAPFNGFATRRIEYVSSLPMEFAM